ncbi:CRISPR-associated endoribonuclease Cas6 [Candidatus Poribacteria bacterium]|nr:MAG: CRISPR-associated endoribonuclease Cas6 [Candidatus Poribacteria bacterium]
MPISTHISLIPETDVTLRPTMGHHAHAAFLSILKESTPEIAEAVHAHAAQKPFTVSPLIAKMEKRGHLCHIRAGTECKLRFTFLDDALFQHFGKAFLTLTMPPIQLGAAVFQVRQMVSHATEERSWGKSETYADLVESANVATHIHLKFHSPTAFRTLTPRGQKRYNHTQVDPVRCYQSWINKWNAFTPLQFDRDELLAFITQHARVSHTQTRTQALNFGKHTEIGWVGTCTFDFQQESVLDEQLLRAANCLADFAFYCGTGYKTTMGMGQTRRIDKRRG